jgi:hypothetical protein
MKYPDGQRLNNTEVIEYRIELLFVSHFIVYIIYIHTVYNRLFVLCCMYREILFPIDR